MRLLCDEMLKRVGRWLRAAGYDVAIVEDGARDDDLLKRATAEHRLLLTCDRRLAGRRPVEPLVTSDIPGSRVRVGGRRVLQVRGSSGAAADGAGR
jgi:uncharacterized protein with PIN domain